LPTKIKKTLLFAVRARRECRRATFDIEFEGIQGTGPQKKLSAKKFLQQWIKKNKEEQKRKGDVLGGQGDQRGQLVSYVVSRW
jgi:hypothetical protein